MTGKAEKREEKEKEKAKDEKKDQKDEIITAIYKLNLHCKECGSKIKKRLLITQGIHSVETDVEKGEIKVKGKLDPIKIQKLIEKKIKRNVELVSPKIKIKESTPTDTKVKEIKQPIVRTMSAKVHMHCEKCEHDLRNKLLKHKGIYSVKTDMKAQTITIEGTIDPDKLIAFLKKKVHKHAEIITPKAAEKKDEKKDQKGKGEGKSSDPTIKEKGVEGKSSDPPIKERGGEGKSSDPPIKEKGGEGKSSDPPIKEKGGEGKSGEASKTIQVKDEETKVEVNKVKENVPYFIHYVYAPQLFSDENPNACCIL
ncbi:Heavy metal-associated isoprenylated plant protein [Quillaja saponaria]|uniref:Heavy metal-associated isoprenylated plant protein n=1 Tax=Quillaja saponaria TaxID=32244 RepID=A0AAD7L4D4_QUISA|nr:Heavy metal-associated isoprenylated plant protein [Quillaja saponaria]